MSNSIRKTPGAEVARWQAPVLGPASGTSRVLDVSHDREQARREGFEQGLSEGLAAADAQVQQLKELLQCMIEAVQEPLIAADDEVVDQVTRLATKIASRLVRRELRTNPSEVIGTVREALKILPLGLSHVSLHLHPDDARLVSDTLHPGDGKSAWTIVEDPVISRGGCRISSDSSHIDATVETRLSRVINAVLGGERDEDRQQD